MKEVQLTKEIVVNGETTKLLKFDFEKITGREIISAEKKARALGDQTPAIVYGMTYQLIIAGLASGANLEDIQDLPGSDVLDILGEVNSFLFTRN